MYVVIVEEGKTKSHRLGLNETVVAVAFEDTPDDVDGWYHAGSLKIRSCSRSRQARISLT